MRVQCPRFVVVAAAVVFAAVSLPETDAVRYTVGGASFWNSNVNYTVWAQDKHFYNGDWLYFVYDRNQYNVLEVNQTDYISCSDANPIHNWTTGAGRDVVPLNVTRTYYFISGKGFCFSGTKVEIDVQNPPAPSSSPTNGGAKPTLSASAFLPVVMILVIFFWYCS